LYKQGADPRYTIAPSSNFGFSAPIVQITAFGATPAIAIKTADVVGQAMTRELDGMQQQHGTAPRYRIEAQEVAAAHDARLKASGKLRSLVAVMVLGGIILFVVVSVADAVSTIRSQRRNRGQGSVGRGDHVGAGAHVEPFLRPDASVAEQPVGPVVREERASESNGSRGFGTSRPTRRLASLPDPNPGAERLPLRPWQ
jgi:hypothetical protein